MNRNKLYFLGMCIVSAGVAFVLTLQAAPKNPPPSSSQSQLNITTNEWANLRRFDPTFESDSNTMNTALTSERNKLADLIANTQSTDDAILAQVEKVIAAHDQLERRIAQHMIKIRKQLTAPQQKQLMGVASETVRQGGFRWRGGRGAASQPTTAADNSQPVRHGPNRSK